jgi:ABC-type dipeptide/oligopeptide/nickel transport system ATPase component
LTKFWLTKAWPGKGFLTKGYGTKAPHLLPVAPGVTGARGSAAHPSSPGWPWPAWPLGQQRAIRQRAEALLARVGIGADRYDSYPHEFSGGMRQRLAIALAMALQPPLVIADEPTTSLDVAVAGQVMAELTALCQEAGSALLLISHDLALAGRWCDRIAVLDQGRLVEQAAARQLLTEPRSALAQRLVAAARAREGQATPPPAARRPCCWRLTSCAAGIPWPPCPGNSAGSRPSMASACGSTRAKRWGWSAPPAAARAPSAAP